MSEVGGLVRELCPNGVNFRPLADLGVWQGGGTPSKQSRQYWLNGTIPWVTSKDMGAFELPGTEDCITEAAVKGSAAKLIPANSIALVMRSGVLKHTLPVSLVPFQSTVNQDLRALTCHEDVLPRYALHALRANSSRMLAKCRKVGGTVESIDARKLMAFRIPVPRLEVQREIVRILDLFTTLETELEAELEARRLQYAHYRDSLLTFLGDDEVRFVQLGEIADFKYGFTATANIAGSHRLLRITDINPQGKLMPSGARYVNLSEECAACIVQPGDLLMARTGATYGKTMLVESDDPAVYASFLIRIRFPRGNVLPSYYWHFAQGSQYWRQVDAMVSKGGQPQFNANALKLVKMPVPPVDEQQRIVGILDKFDALANDLAVGLPAELSHRRKQYEYYRDRLLTFEEAVA